MIITACSLPVILIAALAISRRTAPASASSSALNIGFAPVNRPAPTFDLPRLEGKGAIRLSQLHGKPVVINFWSSTCTVCKKETPAIAQVSRATGNRIYYLGIDTLDLRTAANSFVSKYKLSYQMAFDATGVAAIRYGVPGLPETFFLSRNGKRIIGINLGALTVNILTGILHKLYGSA